jgi:hypothetical protein
MKRKMSSQYLQDAIGIAIARGFDPPSGTIVLLTVFKNIKPLTFEILETWRVGEAQQVAGGKYGVRFVRAPQYRLTISKGIGGMDVTLDDIVVHQAVDNVGALSIGRAKDQRVP